MGESTGDKIELVKDGWWVVCFCLFVCRGAPGSWKINRKGGGKTKLETLLDEIELLAGEEKEEGVLVGQDGGL